ncbi:hypothetical protein [Desertimonas flava]|uniref:hypothetical protein n=1 Tax=Desertimonas flava TaxID=2064846 RepID=UPI0013C50F29|nr:hypothetical protein [Desertimonas flava]
MLAGDVVWGSVGEWVSGTGSIAAVIIAVLSMRRARQSERLSESAVREASRAADGALAAVAEASRARIDDRSAHLAVRIQRTTEDWHYSSAYERLFANNPRPWELEFDQLDLPFYAVEEAPGSLWFKLDGDITNEGTTTTRVRLDGEARFTEAFVDEIRYGEVVDSEVSLAPGDSVRFEWWPGASTTEFLRASRGETDRGRLMLVITGRDLHGRYVDHVFVTGNGRPFQQEPGRPHSWIASPTPIGVTVNRARRTYYALGETLTGPPEDLWG